VKSRRTARGELGKNQIEEPLVGYTITEIKSQISARGEQSMANTLKGKTLTTWTIILPNENVAKKFMESVSGHFEFMQTRSF
tara:strand:- start:60 stop:305 length:246 start_codon:yes stop_codon:yes gene_type:complete